MEREYGFKKHLGDTLREFANELNIRGYREKGIRNSFKFSGHQTAGR